MSLSEIFFCSGLKAQHQKQDCLSLLCVCNASELSMPARRTQLSKAFSEGEDGRCHLISREEQMPRFGSHARSRKSTPLAAARSQLPLFPQSTMFLSRFHCRLIIQSGQQIDLSSLQPSILCVVVNCHLVQTVKYPPCTWSTE